MVDIYKKVINFSIKYGFLKASGTEFSFGPLAVLLANNIRDQWLSNNVVQSDLNTLLYDSRPEGCWQQDCHPSFVHAVQITKEQLPFGLASTYSSLSAEVNDTNTQPQEQSGVFRKLVFISEKDSQQYFYRLQRQRKIWWRKHSTDPERFTIKEENGDEKTDTVIITSNFPWKSEIVEIIHHHKSELLTAYGEMFEIKKGRKKKMLPAVVESVCMERAAVMTYLCDAYQELPARTVLRLHHTLSPYKVALAVNPSDEQAEEQDRLAKFLTLSLRKAGLHTLFCPGSRSSSTLDSQLSAYDSVGVPYTIVISPDALTNGIVGLRSRDTTLQEQVHVGRLVEYVKKLSTK